MKNCISVADVQMCWIVYSSHDMYIVGISKGNIRPDPDIWQKAATLVPGAQPRVPSFSFLVES